MKMYELISDLKELGYWKGLLCKESMRTLNRYYDLYMLILKYEPERKYGYVSRLLARDEFKALLPKDSFGAVRWEANNIYWVIQEMEREVLKDDKSPRPCC